MSTAAEARRELAAASSPLSLVKTLGFARVLSTLASDERGEEATLRRAILAGLLDAGVRGVSVASVWVRPQPDSPLQVLVTDGRSRVGHAGSDPEGPLLFPIGTRGIPIGVDETTGFIEHFSDWVRCAGRMDPLLREQAEESVKPEQRWTASPFDDVVGYLWGTAFAWVVYCHPWTEEAIKRELDQVRRELFRLRQAGRLSEDDAVAAERHEAWYREVARVGSGGVWDVSIWIGASTPTAIAEIAPLLCGAAQQSVSRYMIRPLDHSVVKDGAFVAASGEAGQHFGTTPFPGTTPLVAALVRPPESELPGIRVIAPPIFDTTPETRTTSGASIELGRVLDRFLRPTGTLAVSLDTLNRHTFVCGATGGGKSQTVRSVLESLSRAQNPVPWLVIEPAKAEYARMAGRLEDSASGGVVVIRPGARHAPPGSLNPLEPSSLSHGDPDRTFPLQGHADLVRALFLAAFQSEEPFPQVLSRALTECYERAGWDLVTGEPLVTWDPANGQPALIAEHLAVPRFPTLGDLQRIAARVVDEIGYGEDVKKNVRGFVDIRIGSLRQGAPGRFFEGGHPLDIAALLRRNVVIEAESVTNDQDKAFVMGAVLIRLYEQLALEEKERLSREGGRPRLRHITVIEEAHRLLRNVVGESQAAHSLELFASVLAEVRAYGEGIIVAEQIPSKLIPDVIKNTALKVVHRLPASDDRFTVGATMNLAEDQSAYIVTLEPGVAAVFTDGMDRPVLTVLPAGGDERESDKNALTRPPLLAGQRRSRACGTKCRDESPCTLLQMRHAERLLEQHPEVTLWMEVSAAAHVLGLPAPSFADGHGIGEIRELATADLRLVECMTAYAVEGAVASRYQELRHFYDPDALGHHLSLAAIFVVVNPDDISFCKPDAGIWQAGMLRYADVESDLRKLGGGDSSGRPHAEVVRRAAERGLGLRGQTVEEQLTYLVQLPWCRISKEQTARLMLGTESPSRLHTAARALAGAVDDEKLLPAVFRMLRWRRPDDEEALINWLRPGLKLPAATVDVTSTP